MSAHKIRAVLTMDELREHVVNWSDDTIRRRIKDSGFPAMRDQHSRSFLFDRDEVLTWFRARKLKPSRKLRNNK